MAESRTTKPVYIALGGSQHPRLVVRESLAELASTLTSVDAPAEATAIYNSNGSLLRAAAPFSESQPDWFKAAVEPATPLQATDEDTKMFYARAAAVCAALAARMADVASGEQELLLSGDDTRCTCIWCWVGVQT
jgi:hypothetical protein